MWRRVCSQMGSKIGGTMNGRRVGVALSLWATLGGATALGMAFIPEANTAQQAKWAVDCFNGNSSACYEDNVHDATLSQWRSRAWSTGGASAVMLAVGLSLIAGGRASEGATAKSTSKRSSRS